MVAAVIVLYNPDKPLLGRLLRSVVAEVEKIFVIDNTPGSTEEFSSYFDEYQSCISYLPLGVNKGIATAQNIGIRKSMGAACSHVLLLDQDSALPPGMVKKLLDAEQELLSEGKKVAAIGPMFVDEKTGNFPRAIRHILPRDEIASDQDSRKPVVADCLLASGSLIRSVVFSAVGMMLDELFIDLVDVEWGLRAKGKGYKSYIIPSVILRHSIGDAAIQLLGREIYLHSNIRNCYIVRNSAYLLRFSTMGWKWKTATIPKIPCYLFLYSWYSDHKFRSFVLLSKALLDGIRGKLGGLNYTGVLNGCA